MRPFATNAAAREWIAPARAGDALAFHRSIPGYAATPLAEVRPGVWVKDESDRFGLPAFKVLGASWAANVAIGSQLGLTPAPTFAELASRETDVTLVTATDGNHGRALAWVARQLGLNARIYVAGGLPDSTIQAIRDEGADVVETGAIYDDAVRMAAASGDLLIQDTAWDGYEAIPRAIVTGYSTLFAEIDERLTQDLVVVPTGVGSLLQAALEHYRSADGPRPAVLAVEPVTAACVTASLAAGAPVSVDTSAPTIMAGLNCGTVSSIAWPAVRDGLDAAIGVTDDETRAAMRELHATGLAAGPCGAAALAGFDAAGLEAATVVLVSTEGIAANSA
ncbi:pyridoxal-phosphate dependent enzyme [Solirubrobacter soli]|uniref:pyridoxal-phosphate dependent enzyme n=1 Tax=Solirubrobacter soli TaxID=363832 RepID=UPI0004021635|nr:pyridoxal-phosphate dependent enzyme [Solirubrobacter soli]